MGNAVKIALPPSGTVKSAEWGGVQNASNPDEAYGGVVLYDTTGAAISSTNPSSVNVAKVAGVVVPGSGGALPIADNNGIALRTPSVFKTASATAAGSTAVWTPTSGKKFRLMRVIVTLSTNATQAVGGIITASFLDAAGAIGVAFDTYVPTAVTTPLPGEVVVGQFDLGNGFLSALANNVLNVSLSAALTAGQLRINVAGTEE